MLIELDDRELKVIRGLLEQDLNDLLLGIARADYREAREELRRREELVQGVLDRLNAVRAA